MAKLTEQEFQKELSSGVIGSLYFIGGEEKYLVKKYTSRLIEKVSGKKPSTFDLVRLGSASSQEEIFSVSEQLPLFNQRKCVLVSDFAFEGMNDSDLKLYEEFFSDMSPSTVLVFSMPTANPAESQKSGDTKSVKSKRFLSLIEKYGKVLIVSKREGASLERQLIDWAKKNGCILSRNNASGIIEMCGADMTLLKNEIDKLSAFANGQEITEQMIALLTVRNTEVRVFALSNCLSSGDYRGAFDQLNDLFEQNEKPEVILSVLSSVYVDMYRMRVATESGKTASDVSSDFKYGKREFLLKSAYNNSRKYTTETLRAILDVILQTDKALKSKPYDSRILMETLLAKLMLTVREVKA